MNTITKFGVGAGLIASSLSFGGMPETKNSSAQCSSVAHSKNTMPAGDLKCPPVKIGVVDPVKVYENYKKAKAAQEKFELLVKQVQGEIDKRMEKVKALFKDRDEWVKKYQNPSTAEDVKAKLVEDLRALDEKVQREGEEINLFRQESDRNLDEQRHKILSEHYKEIEYIVQKISREMNLHITLNTQSVFYTSHCIIDITDRVISELNKTTTDASTTTKVSSSIPTKNESPSRTSRADDMNKAVLSGAQKSRAHAYNNNL